MERALVEKKYPFKVGHTFVHTNVSIFRTPESDGYRFMNEPLVFNLLTNAADRIPFDELRWQGGRLELLRNRIQRYQDKKEPDWSRHRQETWWQTCLPY